MFHFLNHSLGLPKLTDAWVQTYVEVQEVGIQVGPEDFCNWCNNWRVECNHSNSAMRPRDANAQRQNHQYPNYQRANLDEEDDGYNGSSDNADDDRDEDVKTLHISATSTRLERRKLTNTGTKTLPFDILAWLDYRNFRSNLDKYYL